MKKKTIFSAIAVVLVATIAIVGINLRNNQNSGNKIETIEPVKASSNTTATFFFHGYGSSYRAEDKMAQAIRRSGKSNSVTRINVRPDGSVVFHGRIPRNAKNPIIEVNLDDNTLSRASSYTSGYSNPGAVYVRNAINAVNRRYGYNKVNIVAHSMGNLESAYYFKRFIRTNSNIKVQHYVAIAGHFDGIVGMNDCANSLKIDARTGKPNRMEPEYRGLLSLRNTFPRNTRVLNIYGNLDNGTNSDGSVSVGSARSLRYLLNGRAKSYRELEIHGRNAQHSRLHNNTQVNNALINFLF